ncbi:MULTISPECIES: DUF2380 domain-containing protein [unclassified Sinorhizobium]|uniref:DUF2380 domain-containing protein n=1 Tax=unclassified Sinorhizobium TaxID=2613772 RepID=UPI0024C3C3D9|nr:MULTISPECIES: DUF2380 domain-containing protein [unclassified Sinorhizobium]MDK1377707.1 DUF2380 domain-containing protein [Sinorhizobium sp. 6-70]MDK1478667.1 DUF2380 domain-containing protein [Sinorhizobium sp. 6-117]
MRIRILTVLVALVAGTWPFAQAQQKRPMSIEVFPFELEDKSAGAGVIAPDDYDRRYLVESAKVAKDMLSKSGRFSVVDVPAENEQAAAPHGLRNCGGCEAPIAKAHGASLALLGVVTRVNRTEHTMFIRILDAETGKQVSAGFTNLRMGANHAWPRSAKWLMANRILQ